jgi:rieske iron-sulfur protein
MRGGGEVSACSACAVNRRTILKGMAIAGLVTAGGRVAAEDDPKMMPPQAGDYLTLLAGGDGPLTPDQLGIGERPVRAWPVDPESNEARNGTLFNLILVSRWNPEDLGPEAQDRHADGVVALTAICTHSACETTDWNEEFLLMECPCHYSQFDPRRNGAVVQGPATRALPTLALAFEGDRIVVVDVFDGRVGGDV